MFQLWLMYFYILSLLLTNSNVYMIWVLMEFIFLYFLLMILTKEMKSIGLIVYFFFQGSMSMFLFFSMVFSMKKIVFLILMAKLGLFPFFYWMVIVSVKVGYWGNIFVLGFQKLSVFWLLWLLNDISLFVLYFFCYMSMFFVVISLLMISDIWLFLVYSSIANTAMLILSIQGNFYFNIVLLYLGMIIMIISLLKYSVSFSEVMFIVFLFLVVPPFILFFMKFYIISSLDFYSKLGFYLSFFDVLILFYYFSFIFMKILLLETSSMFYFMNFFMVFVVLLFSNCVTMIFFY